MNRRVCRHPFAALFGCLAGLSSVVPAPATAGCDPDTTVDIADAPAVLEGDAGTGLAVFEVTISPSDFCTREVFFSTQDGSATTTDDDYAQTDGSFFFAQAGPPVMTIEVLVLGDVEIEPNEDFFVLIDADGGMIGDGQGRAVILNDDFPPTLAIDDVTLGEGDAGTSEAVFTVTRSGVPGTSTVDFATRNGTATLGDDDYESASGTLTFVPGGPVAQTVAVTVNGDPRVEPDETFRVELFNADGATLTDGQGLGTILNDDQAAPPAVSEAHLLPAAPIGEGAGSATVTVERAGDATGGAQVTVRFRRGTAAPGRDFVAGEQVVAWGAGQSGPRPATVQLLDDSREEDDETIEVVLESPVGLVLGDPSAIELVLLDDEQPTGLIQLGEPEVITIVNAVAELAVRVTDPQAQPVAGATVRWQASEGIELLLGETTLSNAQGVARQRAQLDDQPGVATVDATLAATGETVTFRLVVQGDLASLFDPTVSPGEASVAAALDAACVAPAGDFGTLCDYLFALGDDDQRTVVGEVTPREASAQGTLSLDMATSQLRAVGTRLAALRGSATRLAVDQIALVIEDELLLLQELRYGAARFRDEEAWAAQRVTRAVDAAAGQDEPAVVAPEDSLDVESPWGVFLSGRIAFGDRQRTNREEGFEADIVALTAGLDYRFGDRFVLGGALGYLDTGVDLDADGGGLDAQGFSLTGYASYFRTAFYFEASLGLASNDFELARHIDLPVAFEGQSRLVATARADGDQTAASLGVGYDAPLGAASLEGFARASWVDAAVDGYTESGAGPFDLAIGAQDLESLLSEVGLGLSYAASFGWGVLQPIVRAAYLHEFEDDSRLIRGRFVDDVQANQFLVPTEEPDRDFFNLSAGVAATAARGGSFFLT
ncbi:MAG: autotransporter domain-containing protein, partial [Thermoanaerobaculia bacterium]